MANYPTSASTNANLYVAVNNLSTVLSGAINNSVTTITVASTTGFPTTGYITIDAEAISYTSTNATQFLGCTRGADGTAADSHADLANVLHTVVAAHHNLPKDEIIAIETDLVNTLASITPVSAANTATSVLNRLAQIVDQIKTMAGTTNWYDATSAMLNKSGGTMTGDIAMGSNDITGAAQVQSTLITAGADGATGTMEVYPASTSKGKTTFTASDNTGNTTTNINTALQSGARTYTVPDAGASASFVMTGGTQTISGTKTFDGQLIGKGTATNDSAAAGYIGEYVESIAAGTSNAAATDTYDDLTSISLTAGDWDVSGVIRWQSNGATWSDARLAITSAAGNDTTGLTLGSNGVTFGFGSTSTVITEISMTIPTYRFSLTSTTTIYLKRRVTYSAGTPRTAGGRLSARRVR